MPGVLVNALSLAVVQAAALLGMATVVRVLACVLIARLFVVAFRARRLGAEWY